ncbi:MAG: hypothetical protein Q7R90_01915 [bacterium]|nr:hypothetical protein [bacterium]
MADRLFVVAAKYVTDGAGGDISTNFLKRSGAQVPNITEFEKFGYAKFRDDIPDTPCWDMSLRELRSKRNYCEFHTGHENGFVDSIRSMSNSILLMEWDDFDRFEVLCALANVPVTYHIFDGQLQRR